MSKSRELLEQLGLGEAPLGVGGTDTCVCTKCGFEVPHEKGVPCNTNPCPQCGEEMAGKDMSHSASEGPPPPPPPGPKPFPKPFPSPKFTHVSTIPWSYFTTPTYIDTNINDTSVEVCAGLISARIPGSKLTYADGKGIIITPNGLAITVSK